MSDIGPIHLRSDPHQFGPRAGPRQRAALLVPGGDGHQPEATRGPPETTLPPSRSLYFCPSTCLSVYISTCPSTCSLSLYIDD